MKNIFFVVVSLLFTSCSDFKELTFTGIDHVSIIDFSKNGIEAEVTAKIKNPNGISFTIYKSEMDVKLSGIDVGKAILTDNVHIKRKSEQVYTFKIKSDFSKVGLFDLPKILSVVVNNQVTVGLKGDLKVGKAFIKRIVKVDLKENVPINGK
jgi:LEA14-like dessication related protein